MIDTFNLYGSMLNKVPNDPVEMSEVITALIIHNYA